MAACFESDADVIDADVIDAAAERQTGFLRTFQTGPDAELAERLLNEVAAARVCLLKPASKAEYDDSLRDAAAEAEPPPAIAEVPAGGKKKPKKNKSQVDLIMKKALILLLTPFIALPPLASKASEKPNIIFIFSDDMGYGDLGYTGSSQIKTPHLDKLAKEGVIFPQAYVTAPVCGPSRAGVLTGRYQQRFGFETNPGGARHLRPETIGLPDRELTLGNRMQEAGYHTAAIGKWHMGYTDNFYPTERGFDYFFGMRGGGHRYHVTLEPMENIWYRNFGLERMGKKLDEVEVPYLTDWLTEDAMNYISRREENDEQPWFVYLAYNCPHGPLQAKDEDIARYPDVKPTGRQTYCAMVDCLDQNVGRLMEHLEKTEEADNTVIIFMNDNGGSTETVHALNSPFWGHKGTFWEGGIRVPMFIHGLDIEAGEYPHPVSALDIMPTMMALGGKPFEPETITTSRGKKVPVIYDGVDLLPYLHDEMQDARPHQQLFWRMMPIGSAMRDGDWKLIFTTFQPPQLYDLVSDPAERNDLAAENPAVVTRMMVAHGNWCNSFERAPIWLGVDNHSRLHRREYQLTQPEVSPN